MATIPKLIKAALNFGRTLPEQVLAQGYAVLKGLTGNANFTTLPVDLALLKSTLDAYSVAIGEARVVLNIDQGSSGVLLASIKSVRGAKTYDVRFGPVGAGGATPPSWSMKTVAKIKPPVAIDGLTPGTTYAIQVRAYGPLGHTEWSDSATRMCI